MEWLDRFIGWIILIFFSCLICGLIIGFRHDAAQAASDRKECASFGGHIIKLEHDLLCVTPDGRIITAY